MKEKQCSDFTLAWLSYFRYQNVFKHFNLYHKTSSVKTTIEAAIRKENPISQDFKEKDGRELPNMKASKLLLGIYSYINIFSFPFMQYPRSLTRLRC